LGSRTALIAGFGALLVLIAIICIDSLRTLRTFETNAIQSRRDFLYREHTLEHVRAALYETGNIIRDYGLMDSDSHAQEMLRSEFQSIRTETMAALEARIDSLPIGKKDPFQRLAAELETDWSTIEPLLGLVAEDKMGQEKLLLNRGVPSQHAAILAIAKEISAVNDAELQEADRRLQEASALFRSRLLTVGAIASPLGLILAATTIIYVGRLERSLEKKYRESLRVQNELKELSQRLVDTEERERRAVSRELHDEVGQSLSALLLNVESLAEIPREEEAFRERLENVKALAENCVNDVRNMALLLRPSMLDDLGLIPALEWQAREFSKRTGMVVETVEENVSDSLPETHKTCVYRIVQEALNNCSKHAQAKNVRVVVRQEPHRLRVMVADDGKGFDSRRVRGLGLVGMNERVSQLGGELKLDSDPTTGTRLRIDLPLSS
jgi:signal transduction histidine kinase